MSFREMPREAQEYLRAKWHRDAWHQYETLQRARRDLRIGLFFGAVSAMVFVPCFGHASWWFYPLWGALGAVLGRRVVTREHAPLVGAIAYGGTLIVASLLCHATSAISLANGPTGVFGFARILIAWKMWLLTGGVIAFVMEQHRQETGLG